MTPLDARLIEYIANTLDTAAAVGIEYIIIEKSTIRAVNKTTTVSIFQDNNIPELPFDQLGISVNNFRKRYAVVKSYEDLVMTASIDNDVVKNLNMHAKGIKLDCRCMNPDKIKAPKFINDNMSYRFSISTNELQVLKKGIDSMSAENIAIHKKEDILIFEAYDISDDVFAFEIPQPYENPDKNWSNKYPANDFILMLSKAMNEGNNAEFLVGVNGMLNININDLDVYIIPQI